MTKPKLNPEEIPVLCYEGTRAVQRPRAFHHGGRWVQVSEILDHELVSGPNRGDPVVEWFQVRTDVLGTVWISLDNEKWFFYGSERK